jgi:hypothetical protein
LGVQHQEDARVAYLVTLAGEIEAAPVSIVV